MDDFDSLKFKIIVVAGGNGYAKITLVSVKNLKKDENSINFEN